MSITQPTFDNLSRALSDLKFPALSFSQADLLVEHTGVAKLQTLIAGARVNVEQDRLQLEQRVTAVRAHHTLLELGFRESSLPATIAVITAHGIAKVRVTVGDAIKGDQNAKTILSGWLSQASAASPDLGSIPSENHQSRQTRQPIHPTPVPPPAQRTMPVERAATTSASQSARSAQPRPEQSSRPAANQAAPSTNVLPIRPEAEARRALGPQGERHDPSASSNARNVLPAARQYDQVDAYGGDVAIQFERCATKDRSTNTINLKCARAKPGGKTRNGCDWANSILVMLTPHEVQLVAAVMIGYLPKFRAAGHGQSNDKWFEVEETIDAYAGAIRFTVAQGKGESRDIRKVSVGSADIGQVLAIFLRAAQDQLRVTGPLLLAAIRRTADLYAKSVAAKPGAGQGNQEARRAG